MSFAWPALLWGALLLPLLAAGVLRSQRRRARARLAHPRVGDLREAARRSSPARLYIPVALYLLAILAAVVGTARPQLVLPVPTDRAAVMLAIDVSGSMLSQDVRPSRLEAARAAALDFVASLPRGVRVGLVTFAGDAVLLASPTTDHERVARTIEGITVRHRTAIGEGLLEAVAALPGRVRPLPDGTLPPLPQDPRPPGYVVLLSDGQSNTGIDPLVAADLARRKDVTVFTVGIGRRTIPDTGWVIGGPLDEATLQAIAERTHGHYYHPRSSVELRDIYRRLARRIGWEYRPVEVTALAGVLGAALLGASLVLAALRWPLEA